jgi:hypothetical protein
LNPSKGSHKDIGHAFSSQKLLDKAVKNFPPIQSMCLRTFPDFSSQCVYYFSGSEIIWGSNMFGHFFQVAWTQQSNLRSIGLQEQPLLDPYRREVHVTLQKAWCSTS